MGKSSREKLEEAKISAENSAQAQTSAMLDDFTDVKGVRFYKPTFAHVWFFQRIGAMPAIFKTSFLDVGTVMCYLLTFDSRRVRTDAKTALERGQLVDDAYGFFVKNEILPSDLNGVTTSYLAEWLGGGEKKSEAPAMNEVPDPVLSGGPML